MRVESLLTFIGVTTTHPSLVPTSTKLEMYVMDKILYATFYDDIDELTYDRVVTIDSDALVDHGLSYYSEVTGGRNKFNIFAPNATTEKLVLSSYVIGSDNMFEWVDINDWIPTTYWSSNESGLYPTTVTDRVTIGETASSAGDGNMLYVKGTQSIKDGLFKTLDSTGHIQATYKDTNTTPLVDKPMVGNFGGYLITHTDNATAALFHFSETGVTLDHLMTYLTPSDISSGDVSIVTARSMENSFDDTGYGFRRKKSTGSYSTTTITIDHSLYEYDDITYNGVGLLTVTLSNPRQNKIYTMKVVSTSSGQGFIWPSTVSVVSGEFISNATNYVQIMCINETTPEYLVTLSQEIGMTNKASYAITDMSDVANDYSSLPNRMLRVDSTGTSIIFSSLLGGTVNSTDNYIPTWNGTSGALLNDGYAVSTDLNAYYTSEYLASADVIKTAIDTHKVQSVSASATIEEDTKVILVDKSTGDITLTFPDIANSSRARVWTIKDITDSDNSYKVTIAIAGDNYTIEGATTFEIAGSSFARDIIFLNNYYIA